MTNSLLCAKFGGSRPRIFRLSTRFRYHGRVSSRWTRKGGHKTAKPKVDFRLEKIFIVRFDPKF